MPLDIDEKIKPTLMDAKTASKFCGVSLSLWYSLDTQGRCPQSVKLNSKKLWSTRLLELWAINGCVSRDSEQWQEVLRLEREK